MSIDGSSDGGETTLAFSVSAIERFENPVVVFEDARNWSQHVGVVDNELDAVERIVTEHDLRQDFDLGDRDIWLAMEGIREAAHTPRHVYVGTTADDRRVSTHLGWEFVSVTEAAEKADWTLSGEQPTSEGGEGGVVDRFLRAIPDGLLPSRSN